MLQVIRFLLHTIIDFMKMLFTIDIGNNMSLGLLMCIVFIFLPMMLRIISFLKRDAMEELNDRYDESRPINTTSMTLYEKTNIGNNRSTIYRNTVSRRRRQRK